MDDKRFKQLIEAIKTGKKILPKGELTVEQYNEFKAVRNIEIESMKQKAIDEKDWDRYLLYFQSHEMLNGFRQIHKLLSDKEYFKYLGETITILDNFWQYQNNIIKLLHNRGGKGRTYLMNNVERKHFTSLPNTLIIYRGCNQANQRGLSWTLSYKIAEHFTKFLKGGDPKQLFRSGATTKQTEKFNKGKTFILKGECKKKDAFCYFNGRHEEEILVEPENVTIITRKEVI